MNEGIQLLQLTTAVTINQKYLDVMMRLLTKYLQLYVSQQETKFVQS